MVYGIDDIERVRKGNVVHGKGKIMRRIGFIEDRKSCVQYKTDEVNLILKQSDCQKTKG